MLQREFDTPWLVQAAAIYPIQRGDHLFAVMSILYAEPTFFRQDMLRTLDLLQHAGAGPIRLIGRGCGSVVAAFAGLLHPSQPAVELFHYLPSYRPDRTVRLGELLGCSLAEVASGRIAVSVSRE